MEIGQAKPLIPKMLTKNGHCTSTNGKRHCAAECVINGRSSISAVMEGEGDRPEDANDETRIDEGREKKMEGKTQKRSRGGQP